MKKFFKCFFVSIMVFFTAQLLALDAQPTHSEFNTIVTPEPDIVQLVEVDGNISESNTVTDNDLVAIPTMVPDEPIPITIAYQYEYNDTFTDNDAVVQNQNFDRMYSF